jgi:PAS domain S-box-containing protein
VPISTEFLREAAELANLGLSELNAEECFTALNPAFLSMLGMRESELLGRNWRAAVHPDHHAEEAEAFRVARSEGRATIEIRAVRADSKIIHQSMTVIRVNDDRGVLTGFRSSRYDVSSYKRDQETLLLAVESAPSGLLILNPAGRIQSANRAIENLFGYTREELEGRPVEMLLPDRFPAAHLEPRHSGRDLVGLRKDGIEIPLHVCFNTIATGEGELILCNIIDIAERVRYQRQLEAAKREAEAANRAKSDFLARMSHEIRTPMNLIMGMNSLLLEGSLSEQQRRHLEISHHNLRRLLRLINGILDLSKVEAGMLTLEALPFDLSEMLHHCGATMAAAIERKGLRLEISMDADVCLHWTGDSERLQQVLLNLIGNSVKFTAQGKIEVRVRAEGVRRGLRFEVIDTGCGVPADKRGLIFEPFQQAEGSMNRAYEGTGLGLSIAKTLVEMMAGKIWIEEKQGPGSKFIFTAFPVAGSQDAGSRSVSTGDSISSAADERPVEPGTRILLVEDNPENVTLMRAYLEDFRLSLDFVSNGVEAVAQRQTGHYDLIMMDIQMPVMDGYTATRAIRKWEASHKAPRIPIVALTAHALMGASAESLAAGCDGHVTKPVERKELVAAIVKFTKGSNAALSEAIAARRPAFLANRRVDVARLKDASAARDFASIQEIGHNLKGIGRGYGFPEMSSIGASIECAAKAHHWSGVEQSIQDLEACLQASGSYGGPVSSASHGG